MKRHIIEWILPSVLIFIMLVIGAKAFADADHKAYTMKQQEICSRGMAQ